MWIQDRLRLKLFTLHKWPTEDMIADFLTKYVDAKTMTKHLDTMGLRFISKEGLGLKLAALLLMIRPTAAENESLGVVIGDIMVSREITLIWTAAFFRDSAGVGNHFTCALPF